MSSGGNNEFVEERCAPVRRAPNAPKRAIPPLPVELKPKFPKAEEIMPVDQPSTPQTPIVEPSPVMKTLEQEVDGVQNGEADGGNPEVSKEVDTPDQLEPKKKKKKAKKPPKKKDDGGAIAVFMDDDEPPKNDGNNAVGQFMEEEEEEKKEPKKEKEKEKPVRPNIVEKEKDSNRDKEGKEKEKPKVKKPKQPKTESLRQKQKTSQSGRQRKTQGSVRKTSKPSNPQPAVPASPAPSNASLKPPIQATANRPAAPLTPEQTAAKEREQLAKEPNDGFLRAMYSKAKQKIVAMSKNPNYVPSETSISDDTLIATEAAIIKPEITAVYGAATDYPKGLIPPPGDKSCPENLFPAGRPFWMNREKLKAPQTKVIMMSVIEVALRSRKFGLTPNPIKVDPFAPYCTVFTDLRKADTDHFTDRFVISNTVTNVCSVKLAIMKISESEKFKKNKSSTTKKKPKRISIPTMCQVYNRREYKKKPILINKPITLGSIKKKKKKGSSNNSYAD